MREKQSKLVRTNAGITLISLIVTVIILIILAGVALAQLTDSGIFMKTQQAKQENQKQTATEMINLKITHIQMASYAEKQELPSLQYLADKLCEDTDMEYVLKQSKAHASLDKIDVADVSSIFTKLKNYPYEFEINRSLQLASIDGVKVDTTQSEEDSIISMTKTELEELINNKIDAKLPNGSNGDDNYSMKEQKIGTWIDGKTIYRKVYDMGMFRINLEATYLSTDYKPTDLDNIISGKFLMQHDSGNVTGALPIHLYCLEDGSYKYKALDNWGESEKRHVYLIIEYTKTTD